MKKLTLIVLTLGLTFGVFAQGVRFSSKTNETKTLQTEIEKHNREKGIFIPKTLSVSSKFANVKAAGCTITDIKAVEDTSKLGDFLATYMLTLNEGTGYYAYSVETSALDTMTDEKLKAEVYAEIEFYKALYAMFGMTFDESTFWKTSGGEQELSGLSGNTLYTIVVICVAPNDTVLVKQEFKTPESVLGGEPALTKYEVKDISTINAFLEVAANEQTAYYRIMFDEDSIMEEYNLLTEDDILNHFAKNNSQRFRGDTIIELGADDILDSWALTPNTAYTVWVIAYNGNGQNATPAKLQFTTLPSTQTGVAELEVFNINNVTSTNAFWEVKKNEHAAYYTVIIEKVETLNQYNVNNEDSMWVYLMNGSTGFYKEDTTWEIGADNITDRYALVPNTTYAVWSLAFNGNKEAGKIQHKEFTTLESTQNGTATFRTMEVEVLGETNARVEFEMGDQTAYYYYFLDNKDTLIHYGEYELEGALDFLEYMKEYYARNGYTYPSFAKDTIFELGDEPGGEYALEKGTEYVVWGFPYNGNKELGEAKRIEFKTDGVGLAEIDFTAVNLYPNPTTDKIVITSKKTIKNIEMVNTLGQVVYSAKANSDNVSIDVAKFDRGNYFVKVTTIDNVITSQQIVVK